MRRHIGGIPQSLAADMENGNYYEALQLYRTLQSRYESAGKYVESDTLLFNGIESMNKYNQTISAYDLANIYLSSLNTRQQSFTITVGDKFIELLQLFPSCEEKEKLITAFSQWCHSKGNALVGYPKLNDYCGHYYYEKKDYYTADGFCQLSENMDFYVKMTLEWARMGYPSEMDLYIARPILWLLSKENIRDATAFFSAAMTTKESASFKDLPLIHFCDFLLQTVERNAPGVFNLLKEKYASQLKRDPAFDKYMTDIGALYFNIHPQNDMLSSMLKMFTGM